MRIQSLYLLMVSLLLWIGSTNTVWAEDVADVYVDITTISFFPTVTHETFYLKVTGEGVNETQQFAYGDAMVISLYDGLAFTEGRYRYELVAASETDPALRTMRQAGFFTVQDGQLQLD